jgi:hypothetical protein
MGQTKAQSSCLQVYADCQFLNEFSDSGMKASDTLKFIEAFPDNPEDFITVLGYDESVPELLLGCAYWNCVQILTAAIKLTSNKEYGDSMIIRMIACTDGLSWHADGVSMLQNFFYTGFIDKSLAMKLLELLETKAKDSQLRFWEFYFESDGMTENLPDALSTCLELGEHAKTEDLVRIVMNERFKH